MEIEIVGVHYHVSDATKEHIYKKTEPLAKQKQWIERVHISISEHGKEGHESYDVHLHGKLKWHNAPIIEIHRHGANLWSVLDETFDAFHLAWQKQKSKHHQFNHEKIHVEESVK